MLGAKCTTFGQGLAIPDRLFSSAHLEFDEGFWKMLQKYSLSTNFEFDEGFWKMLQK